MPCPYGRSSIGRAAVSKTAGCRFESCRPCYPQKKTLPGALQLPQGRAVKRMSKIVDYTQEVTKEMQKVSWPKQKELYSFTLITIVATIIISLLIFGADRVIGIILEFIYGSAG